MDQICQYQILLLQCKFSVTAILFSNKKNIETHTKEEVKMIIKLIKS